jgi:glycine dehydrogenase subunit 2
MLIFDHSRPGRTAAAQLPAAGGSLDDLPADMRRKDAPTLPEVSELDVVRHYTRLSQKNFSIDTQFYPLGSCTMKYNPRACNSLAMLPQFLARHPASPDETGQGFLASMFELQEMLKDVTGMAGVSMAPRPRGARSSCPTRRTAPTRRPRPCAATRSRKSPPTPPAASI